MTISVRLTQRTPESTKLLPIKMSKNRPTFLVDVQLRLLTVELLPLGTAWLGDCLQRDDLHVRPLLTADAAFCTAGTKTTSAAGTLATSPASP